MSADEKVKILVVDDLEEKLLAYQAILESLQEQVIAARSGEDALRQILQHDFAVILMDVNMPGLDGLETAELIRRRKRSAHTPIIFLTAYGDETHAAQSYAQGAVDFMTTPVVPEVLRAKVQVFVDLFRMQQQVRRQADEQIALAAEQARRVAAEEASQRFRYLAEASAVLLASLDSESCLCDLTRLAVPLLADLCLTTVVREDGYRVKWGWVRPSSGQPVCQPIDWQCLDPTLSGAIEQVIRTNELKQFRTLTPGISPARRSLLDDQPAVRHWFDGPLASLVVLPLSRRGTTLGAIAMARASQRDPISEDELSTAQELAFRAAMALENNRLYENAQEADRRKDHFLAVLGHELRNPLAGIVNGIEVLKMAPANSPEGQEMRELIERQAAQMNHLVDDLLDVSRISRGKIQLRKTRLELVELIRATVESFRPRFLESGLELELNLGAEPVWVFADPTRMAQVVGNLLNNALKFTNPGGRVSVACEESAELAFIRIRDTGIGMEPDTLRQIFEPFSQADSSLDRSRGGLGLGLALVKGMLEMHDGHITARSDGTGKGSEFCLQLPLLRQAVVAEGTGQPLPSGEGKPLTVLLIDDRRDAILPLQRLLGRLGHTVCVASTGQAGLEKARETRPEVVFCDIGLPDLDGYEIARAMRADADLCSAYLVAVTGYGQDEDRRRAAEAGFDHHVAKPIAKRQLEMILSTFPRFSASSPLAISPASIAVTDAPLPGKSLQAPPEKAMIEG